MISEKKKKKKLGLVLIYQLALIELFHFIKYCVTNTKLRLWKGKDHILISVHEPQNWMKIMGNKIFKTTSLKMNKQINE